MIQYQQFATIRHTRNKNILGYNDAKTSKPYVIGFNRHGMAQQLCNWLPSDPVIKVRRKTHDNLTYDFNDALSDVGLERFAVDQLTVDYAAHLVIPKREKGDIDDAIVDYTVDSIIGSEFLMYPFERSIGLIIPSDEVVRETSKEFVFYAMIIDPCFNADMFKSSLARSSASE